MTINKCTYLLLSLTGLKKDDFPSFINTYIKGDCTIIVKCTYHQPSKQLTKQSEFKTVLEDQDNNIIYYIYEINRFKQEFALFKEGKYSYFSEEAKNLIKRFSGLDYMKNDNGKITTHVLLLALDKEEAAYDYWVNYLGLEGKTKEEFRAGEYYSSPYLDEEVIQ